LHKLKQGRGNPPTINLIPNQLKLNKMKTKKLYALSIEVLLTTPLISTNRGLTKLELRKLIAKYLTHYTDTGVKFTITEDWSN
jgi:hypothetical protein